MRKEDEQTEKRDRQNKKVRLTNTKRDGQVEKGR
jgi:hypothetical protein